jgi:hypothetical protein
MRLPTVSTLRRLLPFVVRSVVQPMLQPESLLLSPLKALLDVRLGRLPHFAERLS